MAEQRENTAPSWLLPFISDSSCKIRWFILAQQNIQQIDWEQPMFFFAT